MIAPRTASLLMMLMIVLIYVLVLTRGHMTSIPL